MVIEPILLSAETQETEEFVHWEKILVYASWSDVSA